MRYIRFQYADGIHYGRLVNDDTIEELDQAPYLDPKPTGQTLAVSDVQLLAPCEPTKIVCIGKNYHDHIQEFDQKIPENPIVFLKPLTGINQPDGVVEIPPAEVSNRIDYEGELAFVVAKKAKNIPADQAGEYIFGYTLLNDVTARDLQLKDGQWTRGKGFDGFCPFGPWIESEFDPAGQDIVTRLNGQVVQQGNTRDLIWNIGELMAFITTFMTLMPGDIVATGTPAGVGPMQCGDVVEVSMNGLGILRNRLQ